MNIKALAEGPACTHPHALFPKDHEHGFREPGFHYVADAMDMAPADAEPILKSASPEDSAPIPGACKMPGNR